MATASLSLAVAHNCRSLIGWQVTLDLRITFLQGEKSPVQAMEVRHCPQQRWLCLCVVGGEAMGDAGFVGGCAEGEEDGGEGDAIRSPCNSQ